MACCPLSCNAGLSGDAVLASCHLEGLLGLGMTFCLFGTRNISLMSFLMDDGFLTDGLFLRNVLFGSDERG